MCTEVSAKLLVAQFMVSDLSVARRSQDRPVAELQVICIRAELLTRGPYYTQVSLSVHLLLLVDASIPRAISSWLPPRARTN